jgi:hypothetical protein
MSSDIKPTFIAYSVKEREGKPSAWRMIGVVFPNSRKPGFTIQLDALPIGDRIVLLEPKDENAGTPEADTQAVGGNHGA